MDYAPSTYRENPHVDREQYRRQLEASCPTDPELLKAWLDGEWSVTRGAFFSGVLDEHRVALDASLWTPEVFAPSTAAGTGPGKRQVVVKMNAPRRVDDRWRPSFGPADPPVDDWEIFLAYDHGSSAPAVAYLCARSPGATGPDGRYFPRGSVLLLDEVATADPQDLNRGLQWTIPKLAKALVELSERWGMPRAEGAADDACFAAHGHLGGSIADEFSRCGVEFWRAAKGNRVAGWERMRRMLADAGSPDDPGLYVSRACGYFWSAVPFLARDPRRPDDLDSRGPDHAADAARYALGAEKPRFSVMPLGGMYG